MVLKPASVFAFGPFRLEVEERRLLREGAAVPLTPKAFDVLLALVQHAGRLLDKDTLLKIVWPDTFVEENNLADNISRLRKALKDGEHGQRFIETVPRRGYRFIADVTSQNGSPGPAVAAPPPSLVTDDAPRAIPALDAPSAGTRRAPIPKPGVRAVLIACGLILVVAAPWLYVARRNSATVNELLFKGEFYRRTWGEAEMRKAIDYYDRAIALDPNAVEAYSGLAEAWILLSDLHVSPRDAMPRARAATVEVLRRDKASAYGHISMGVIRMQYDWDFAGADREFARAMELEPDETAARMLRGWLRMAEGRLTDAQADMQRAVDERPSSEVNLWSLGISFYFARQYEAAIEQYRRAIALEPRSYWAHLSLGWAYERQGRMADAIKELEETRRLLDTPQVVAALVHAQAAAGRRVEAQATMTSLLEYSKRRFVSPYDLATASAGLGDRTETLAWLEKAYEERCGWLALWLRIDPTFDALRDDDRFRDLLTRVGHTP